MDQVMPKHFQKVLSIERSEMYMCFQPFTTCSLILFYVIRSKVVHIYIWRAYSVGKNIRSIFLPDILNNMHAIAHLTLKLGLGFWSLGLFRGRKLFILTTVLLFCRSLDSFEAFSINMCLFPTLITIGTIADPHPYMILRWEWFMKLANGISHRSCAEVVTMLECPVI